MNEGEYNITKGTEIKNLYVFAGKHGKKPLRVANYLSERYGEKPEEWQHTRGRGFVDYKGKSCEAELHWFNNDEIGGLMKVKFLGESDPLRLISGKVYDVISIEKEWYRIIDETDEDYLYPPEVFEVVEK